MVKSASEGHTHLEYSLLSPCLLLFCCLPSRYSPHITPLLYSLYLIIFLLLFSYLPSRCSPISLSLSFIPLYVCTFHSHFALVRPILLLSITPALYLLYFRIFSYSSWSVAPPTPTRPSSHSPLLLMLILFPIILFLISLRLFTASHKVLPLLLHKVLNNSVLFFHFLRC